MTEERVELVEVKGLKAAEFNPRGHVGDVADLAASIKAVGLITPIRVRPLDEAGIAYEIVCGHRRVAAFASLGLLKIPAIVEEMTTDEAKRTAIVENAMREQPHPMDEAVAIGALTDEGKTIAQMSEELGMSPTLIASRRRLLGLTEASRKAFRAGEIETKSAYVLARITDPELQADALKTLEGSAQHARKDDAWAVERMLPILSRASFDTADESLTDAPACTTCPKRSGNQTALFADALEKDDLCTDAACHKAKSRAAFALEKARAKKDGREVMTAKQAKDISFGTKSEISSWSKYVDVNEPLNKIYDLGTSSRKKIWNWINANAPNLPVHLAQRPDGGPVQVVDRAKLIKAYKKTKKTEPVSDEEKASKKAEREARAKAKLEAEIVDGIESAVRAKVRDELGSMSWGNLDPGRKDAALRAFFRFVLTRMPYALEGETLFADRPDVLEVAAEKMPEGHDRFLDPGDVLEYLEPGMAIGEVMYWTLRILTFTDSPVRYVNEGDNPIPLAWGLGDVFGVDVPAIAQATEAEIRESKTTKKKGSKKSQKEG